MEMRDYAVSQLQEEYPTQEYTLEQIKWAISVLSVDIVSLLISQLASGELSDGSNTPMYADSTLKRKQYYPKTIFGDGIHWSLRDEGNLYRSLKADTDDGESIIFENKATLGLINQMTKHGLVIEQFLSLNELNKQKAFDMINKKLSEKYNGL